RLSPGSGPRVCHRARTDRQPGPAHQLGDPPAAVADQRAGCDGDDGDPQRRGRNRAAQARRRARRGPHHPRRERRRLPPRGLAVISFVLFSMTRAWQGFWRNAVMSLAATATMILMLLLLAGFWIIQTGLLAGLQFTEQKVEVVAYLQTNATDGPGAQSPPGIAV